MIAVAVVACRGSEQVTATRERVQVCIGHIHKKRDPAQELCYVWFQGYGAHPYLIL